jgi:hypothetical protein
MTANGQAEANPRELSVRQLSVRAQNVLRNEGFIDADGNVDVAALRALDDRELKRLHNLGKRTFNELRGTFGDHVPQSPPFEREVARVGSIVRENRSDSVVISEALARNQQVLNQIAVSCNWICSHVREVTSKAALALSDFTDYDLLSELQRRTERRQEELRQTEQLRKAEQSQQAEQSTNSMELTNTL